MSTELMTSWSEHESALQRILPLASQTLCIFDEDLARLKLERSDNAELLRGFVAAGGQRSVRIVLRNAEPFRRASPRLMKLLATYPQYLTVIECPPHIAALADSLFIVDDRHALVRFSKDYPRAKVIIDDAAECAPYVHRFAEIIDEGGEQISATVLGL
jgi:hypothetical protein